ncbi:DsbA family protein [Streptomyces sp. NBC_01465]|uniref:DsbA family protein n=1 Tax=Streptomyces sp. NBC_01465 TaxID=2903878 RepID=UPI002E31A86B|nr:thioredoxin domain-containing protein [Streptomyces sp. NBC_01465]
MSEKNRDGKRAAREQLKIDREKQQAAEKRKRALIVGGAVVAVLAIAAVIGVVVANSGNDDSSTASGPVVAPKGANGKDNLAIPVGASDAPSTLTVWEDFRCPACGQFENTYRDTIHELENSGQIKVEYHLATLIDGNMGGSGSLRAANAAACAQTAGKFPAYHDVLYENQPEETDDAFSSNSKLIELAGKVDGLDTASFKSCVNDGTHDSWVKKSNTAFQNSGYTGTPTVLLNGDAVFPKKGDETITPANLKKWVAEANKGKKAGTVSPSPSSTG